MLMQVCQVQSLKIAMDSMNHVIKLIGEPMPAVGTIETQVRETRNLLKLVRRLTQ